MFLSTNLFPKHSILTLNRHTKSSWFSTQNKCANYQIWKSKRYFERQEIMLCTIYHRSVKTESKIRKRLHCKSQKIFLSYFPAKIFLEKFETFSNIPGHRTLCMTHTKKKPCKIFGSTKSWDILLGIY